MANPTGKGGVRFKPGVSGNPGGRPKDPVVKAIRETTLRDFLKKLQELGKKSKDEIELIVEDSKTPMFDLVFARILVDAANGKSDARQVLLDRLWGKVKEMDITANFSAEHELMRSIPIVELIELARKYVKGSNDG